MSTSDREGPPTADWPARDACRNCGAARGGAPYCGQCGQKAAHRLGLGDLRQETWQKWRLFEWSVARTAGRLLLRPGTVAREYVEGARSRHVHPLKLLLVSVALLLLVLDTTGFLRAGDQTYLGAMAMMQHYANWTFTLGIFAVVASSLLVFGRRRYNAVEHLVLAAYAYAVIIGLNLVNQLPLLVIRDPALVLPWREAAKWYMYAVKVVVLALAFHQFFELDLRRDAWRLALALAVFVAVDWLLRRAYVHAIVALLYARAA
ncbi:DUF3667 domain-containing protein [Luteimonas sp. TWI662]|uniref:DUF3667 domain-containing protein n=1 Tax=unclassified Luteimonas TaxID=2629088 RepID=UPI003207B01C